MIIVVFFFFFQAEDGIRDLTVTGVQTCALPIFDARPRLQNIHHVRDRWHGRVVQEPAPRHQALLHLARAVAKVGEIGRASCREKVYIWEVSNAIVEKYAETNREK